MCFVDLSFPSFRFSGGELIPEFRRDLLEGKINKFAAGEILVRGWFAGYVMIRRQGPPPPSFAAPASRSPSRVPATRRDQERRYVKL